MKLPFVRDTKRFIKFYEIEISLRLLFIIPKIKMTINPPNTILLNKINPWVVYKFALSNVLPIYIIQ